MKVAALCITLMMNVLMLMAAHVLHSYAQKDDADSLHISGSRLQYFEHELIALTCEGFDDVTNWRVMREIKGIETICATAWETSTGQCTIKNAFPGDSGRYWCQGTEEQRSNTVTIHVSAGSVILESPVLPVMEGEAVTLLCRQRKTSGNLPADFYKDGFVIRTSDTGEMTIHNISRSDDGLYKCRIHGSGESSESQMAVRGVKKRHEDVRPSNHRSLHGFFLLCVVVPILLAFLLLLLVGLLLCVKQGAGASTSPPSFHPSTPLQTVSEVNFEADVYATVTKHKKKKGGEKVSSLESGEERVSSAEVYYTLSLAERGGSSSAAPLCPEAFDCHSPRENVLYYTIE